MRKIKEICFLSVILFADFLAVPVFKQTDKMNTSITYEITDSNKNQEISPALKMIEAVLELYKKGYVVCNQLTDGYEIAVYKNFKKIFSDTFPIEPGIIE